MKRAHWLGATVVGAFVVAAWSGCGNGSSPGEASPGGTDGGAGNAGQAGGGEETRDASAGGREGGAAADAACTKTVCAGACVDTSTDAKHCGTCDTACAVGTTCQAGACKPLPGQLGGRCTKNGDCDSKLCLQNGHCSKECAGQSDCPPAPEWRCAPLPSYPDMCQCMESGEEACDGRDNDCDGLIDNGATCEEKGYTCQKGVCACDPTNVCGGGCVDTQTDANNCGGCGKACASGASCQAGTCACPGGGVVCNGKCVDLRVDAANCGACMTACSVACSGGVCTKVGQLVTGQDHTCALLTDGTARCWGYNGTGALGDGTTVSASLPVVVAGISNATQLVAGNLHTCAVLSNGTVRCWGDNRNGQLGDGTSVESSTIPVVVSDLSNVMRLAISTSDATCALLTDGSVRCWGYNSTGQLGDGTRINSSTPVESELSNVTQLAAGAYHMCALLTDGTARCWGANNHGQLGNGTKVTSSTPVVVSGLTDATQLVAGPGYTCARMADGTASCWGDQGWYGTVNDRLTPAEVGITSAAQLAAGSYDVCAIMADRTARCWGANGDGQLGNGTTVNSPNAGVVSGLSNVKQLVAGHNRKDYGTYTCALLADGTANCWGSNSEGALGTGTMVGSSTPVVVSGLVGAAQLVPGPGYVCALLTDGAARCWGDNGYYGRLGGGTTSPGPSTPVAVKF